jgi:hypothetical protein
MRSRAEGGTIFTVCDVCWDKKHPNAPSDRDMRVAVAVHRYAFESEGCGEPNEADMEALTAIVKGVR